MWVLIVAVLWYRAPAVTQVPGFTSLQTCEAAVVAVNAKFTSDGWKNGADQTGSSICVRVQ